MIKIKEQSIINTSGLISFEVSLEEETLTDDSKVYNVITFIVDGKSNGHIPSLGLEDNSSTSYEEGYCLYRKTIDGLSIFKNAE